MKRGKVLLTRAERLTRLYSAYPDIPEVAHLRHGTRLVPGQGSLHPKVMFIGDVPGTEEAKCASALAGMRKAFVFEMLRGIDLKPEHIFVTHLLKFRPPNGRDPRLGEAMRSNFTVLAEMDILKPDVVITWGRYMLDQFARGQKMERVHGQQIVSDHGFMFIPMFSPEAGIVNPHVRSLLVSDFQKVRSLI